MITTIAELAWMRAFAQKLVNLGIDEEEAVKFAISDNQSPFDSVFELERMLPDGNSIYTPETCSNPMCGCNLGGFIETITSCGRMMTPVYCGNPAWEKSKFERI